MAALANIRFPTLTARRNAMYVGMRAILPSRTGPVHRAVSVFCRDAHRSRGAEQRAGGLRRAARPRRTTSGRASRRHPDPVPPRRARPAGRHGVGRCGPLLSADRLRGGVAARGAGAGRPRSRPHRRPTVAGATHAEGPPPAQRRAEGERHRHRRAARAHRPHGRGRRGGGRRAPDDHDRAALRTDLSHLISHRLPMYPGSCLLPERQLVSTQVRPSDPSHDPPVESGSFFSQPRAVWAVAFACVIAFMGIGLVDPILKSIAVQLDATPSQVSLMFTSYMAIMGVAMLVTGVISSRIGAKRTLLSGLVLIIVFAALAGSSNSVGAVVGFRAGWGLGNALFVATALATIVMSASGGTAQAIILFEAALGVGIASGPLVGGLLGEHSWRAPFFGVSTLMVIALVATAFFLPSTPPTGRRTSLADPFRALRHRPLLLTALTAVFYNIGFFTILAAGPFALPAAGIIEIGWIYFGWGVLVALTSVFVAPRVQRLVGTVPAVIGTLVLFMLDLLVMAVYADHAVVVTTGIVLSGAFIGTNNTLITEAVMGVAPVERPVASAAYSFVRFCGGAIGPDRAPQPFRPPPGADRPPPFLFWGLVGAGGGAVIARGARGGDPPPPGAPQRP